MAGGERLTRREQGTKSRSGYKVEAGMHIYYGVVEQNGRLITKTNGDLGSGFYCTDTPSVLSRYFHPQQVGFETRETNTLTSTYHFRLDEQITDKQIAALLKVAASGGKKRAEELKETLKGRFGKEVIDILVDEVRSHEDAKTKQDNDGKNQVELRGEIAKRILHSANYDGTATRDTLRGGMVLTFYT